MSADSFQSKLVLSPDVELQLAPKGYRLKFKGGITALSQEQGDLLLSFAAPRTVREAHALARHGVKLAGFESALEAFREQRVVVPYQSLVRPPSSLLELLSPAFRRLLAEGRSLADSLQGGSVVVVRDAFELAHAERVYEELSSPSLRWVTLEVKGETGSLREHRLHDAVPVPAFTADVCSRLESDEVRRLVSRWSGVDCSGGASARPVARLAGDYEVSTDPRMHTGAIAFTWCLAKAWRHTWGGHLFWPSSSNYIRPDFNMLVLYSTAAAAGAWLTPVVAEAEPRNVSVSGTWGLPAAARSVPAPCVGSSAGTGMKRIAPDIIVNAPPRSGPPRR